MNKLLSTYDLVRAPFGKDIPASEMFETEALSQARERLKTALEARSSAVVTGDSGSGKTCLLRALEEDLPQGRYRLHYVHNAIVNRRDFYRQLSIGMGLEPRAATLRLCLPRSASISKRPPASINCVSFYSWTRPSCCRFKSWINCTSC
jgi:hypothetical protein